MSERTTGAGVDNPTGDSEIFAMKPDSTGLTQLTDNTAGEGKPSWSRNGKKITFVSDRDGNDEIYRMQVGGSLQTLLSNNPALDGDPNWQPLKKRRR